MATTTYAPELNRVSTYNEDRKRSIYLWRECNIDKYRTQQRNYHKEQYSRIGYTDKVKERKRQNYIWKKEVKRLAAIEL
tara:strand:- start:227 stop:463 length:237 start_codon:yes stop_codon:yes gene_type:complete